MEEFKSNNDEIVRELQKRAANYSELKAEILGKLGGVRNFLDGMDLELMGEYDVVKKAVAALPILEELEEIIRRIEK